MQNGKRIWMNARAAALAGAFMAAGLLSPLLFAASPDTKAIPEKPADASQIAFFEKKIRPVLVQHCYSCHSAEAEKIKGGLVLDTREGIRRGGDSGHAVVPGSLKDSLLIEAIRWGTKDFEMPPKQKLPDEVIADFEQWVLMGAPDPRDGAAKVVRQEIDIEKGREFWAFQPPRKSPAPAVKNASWPRSDIDRFIMAALEAKGLQPVADADRRALIRRVYFDLIGLPPTPAEVEAFVNDSSPKAFEKVVDNLLASPHFGERWGRHWLDVARYAESSGKEANITFPHAWRYRDYVIESFNADKPYNRFIQEQVAGDLMPAKSPAERADLIVATGFLALGPKSLNEANTRQFQMDLVDEQIDALSQSVLGLTVACARCHDHKFDPIPTKEYYSLAGIFLSTETYYGTINQQGNRRSTSLIPIPVPDESVDISQAMTPSERARSEKDLESVKQQRAELFAESRALRNNPNAPEAGRARQQLVRLNDQVNRLEARLSSVDELGLPKAFAMGVRDRARPIDARVLIRGEVDKMGETVPRGLVSVLTPGDAPRLNYRGSGRLELAQWLTSSQNPLTARVMANRAWHYLFGRGPVATVDNLGALGERPSHPELLDYLAVRFMENGWSVKSMIREIVLSRAYQLGSEFDQKNYSADPDNVLVWRMNKRRLDAESIRDAILSVSGQLELEPPMASPVAKLGDGFVGRTIRENSIESENNRRSVYLPVVRDLLPDSLSLFDFAEPSLVTGSRDVTTVPSQALYMMNSSFVIQQSERMAARILADSKATPVQRINLAYQLAFSRPPTEAEMKNTGEFFRKFLEVAKKQESDPRRVSAAGWTAFCQALFASAEFRYLN